MELVPMIKALGDWRPEREGVTYPLKLITKHKNLEYFMTKKLLKWNQAQ